MMVIPPALVRATTESIRALVPLAKLSNSNTPAGPFQTTTLALAIASANSSLDLGPQSNPIHPSGIPSSRVAAPTAASSANLSAVTKSTGKWSLTFLALAFSTKLGTILAPSSSYREVPIDMLSIIFLKVKAMPPPMIISSTLSNMLSISWILSATLAPPRIAKNGLCGLSNALEKYVSSFLRRKPAALWLNPSPTILEWAR